RKREEITPHSGDQDLHALNFDAGEPPDRNLLRRAKPLPTQLLAPLRFGSPQPTRLRSGSATPYRGGACREPRFARSSAVRSRPARTGRNTFPSLPPAP